MGFCGMHLRAISQEEFNLLTRIRNNILLKLLPHFPNANELTKAMQQFSLSLPHIMLYIWPCVVLLYHGDMSTLSGASTMIRGNFVREEKQQYLHFFFHIVSSIVIFCDHSLHPPHLPFICIFSHLNVTCGLCVIYVGEDHYSNV